MTDREKGRLDVLVFLVQRVRQARRRSRCVRRPHNGDPTQAFIIGQVEGEELEAWNALQAGKEHFDVKS